MSDSEANGEAGKATHQKARLAGATAARPILDTSQLLSDQEKILKRILHKVRDIADAEGLEEASQGCEKYLHDLRSRRPRQVFFIDGARGAGKTSLLLTVREHLAYLGDESRWTGATGGEPSVEANLAEFAHEALKVSDPGLKCSSPRCRAFYACPVAVGSQKRRVACSLDVLFPSDLEGGQPVMEGIFAFMMQKLTDEESRVSKDACGDWRQQISRIRSLKEKLVREISPGWYLSKNEGKDAIVRDSADYEDFLARMGKASVRAFGRVKDFRQFVIEYLDAFNAELLVVFFDDTDVSPHVTRDMLHAIRIFLDHPRIVTVVAGHLKSMRQSLVWEYLRDIKEPMDAATAAGGGAAVEWRQFQQQQVEEYLEKVLPRQFRNLIRVDHADDLGDSESGPSKILRKTFGDFCAGIQNQLLPEFVRGKQRAYYYDSINYLEIADERHRSELENWMAWYFLRHHYAEPLKPRSVRVQKTMEAMSIPQRGSPALSDWLPTEFRRRLAVFLFENPDNFELIQRFGDTDTRVMRWLRRQQLRSGWVGERYFEINGTKIFEGTYSYSFISFRTDLEIGIPVRETGEDSVPAGLLGRPAGSNLFADRPFYPPMHRQRSFGVAASLRHSVIPANCLYLWDLQCLPDVAWRNETVPGDPWGSRLIYDWPNMFVFETSDWDWNQRTETMSVGSRLKDYLVRVLVPFASVELGAFVAPKWQLTDLREARHDADHTEKSRYLLLREETKNRVGLKRILDQADVIRRRYDYLETIGRDSRGWSSVSDASKELITEWSDLLMGLLLPDTLGSSTSKKLDRMLFDGEVPGDLQSLAFENLPEELRADVLAALGLNRVPQGEKLPNRVYEYWSQSKRLHIDRWYEARARENRLNLSEMLQRHVRSYQWILNDLRRAYHAGRIFSNEASATLRHLETHTTTSEGVASRCGSEQCPSDERRSIHQPQCNAEKKRPERPRNRSDLFKRSDRYTIVTLDAIGRLEAQISKPLELFFVDRWGMGEKLKLKAGVFKKWKSTHAERCARYDLINDIRNIYGAPNRELDLKRFGDGVISTDRAEPLLPLRLSRNSPADADFCQSADDARLARAYFLFVVAIAPCLPALIHVDIASWFHYKENGESKAIRESLDGWAKLLSRFAVFVRHYRRLMENMKFRLDIMQLCENASNANQHAEEELKALRQRIEFFGVNLTLAPDISFATLGAMGLTHFFKVPPKGTRGMRLTFSNKTLQRAFENWAAKKATVTASQINLTLFQDVTENLWAASCFLREMKEYVDEIADDRQAPAA